jgi:signal transduction histidine kinase
VRDNGTGFDVARMQHDPQRGIGLRNLREHGRAGRPVRHRVAATGTRLTASLPTAPQPFPRDFAVMTAPDDDPAVTTSSAAACC